MHHNYISVSWGIKQNNGVCVCRGRGYQKLTCYCLGPIHRFRCLTHFYHRPSISGTISLHHHLNTRRQKRWRSRREVAVSPCERQLAYPAVTRSFCHRGVLFPIRGSAEGLGATTFPRPFCIIAWSTTMCHASACSKLWKRDATFFFHYFFFFYNLQVWQINVMGEIVNISTGTTVLNGH